MVLDEPLTSAPVAPIKAEGIMTLPKALGPAHT